MEESMPQTAKSSIWNLPNILTIARIVMVPILIYLILQEEDDLSRWLALIVFCVAAYTDRIDGNLARKNNQITNFGKIADPIADKLLVLGSFVTLSFLDIPYWWFTITVIVRELAVTGLRMYLLKQSIVVPASKGGKWKTAFQMLLIFMILLAKAGQWYLYDFFPVAGPDYLMPVFRWGIDIVMVIAFVITVLTGLQYFLDAMENAKDAKDDTDEVEDSDDSEEPEDSVNAEEVLADVDDIEEIDPEVADQLAQAQKEAQIAEAELAVLEAELALLQESEGNEDSAEVDVEDGSDGATGHDVEQSLEADPDGSEEDLADGDDFKSVEHDKSSESVDANVVDDRAGSDDEEDTETEEQADDGTKDNLDNEEEPAIAIIDVSDDDISIEDSEAADEDSVEDSEGESDVETDSDVDLEMSSEPEDEAGVEEKKDPEDNADFEAQDDEPGLDISEEILSQLPFISRRDRKRMVRDARRKGISDPESYVDKQLVKAEAMKVAKDEEEDGLELQVTDSDDKADKTVPDESIEDVQPDSIEEADDSETVADSEDPQEAEPNEPEGVGEPQSEEAHEADGEEEAGTGSNSEESEEESEEVNEADSEDENQEEANSDEIVESDSESEESEEADPESETDSEGPEDVELGEDTESESESDKKESAEDPASAKPSRRERRQANRGRKSRGHLQHRIGERPKVIKPQSDQD